MKNLFRVISAAAFTVMPLLASAQNPVVQTMYTPDPAPYVHGDTVYLFADHDEDDAEYFKMKDWLLFSTVDMVNWTYRGTPMSTATFKWAKQGDNAWASQAIERNGKWYWYICAEDKNVGIHGIGVGVADRPEGPYRDAIGKPLVPGNWGYIDPSVFIDDDGQAYLFWGNNGCWYARLNEDMISLASKVIEVKTHDEEAFGPFKKIHDEATGTDTYKTNYEEGPWVFKRNGLYYMVYAAGGVPEHMAYSTAENINGPWRYRGKIQSEAERSFTIHGGSVEFKGRNFMFYHNGMLPGGGGFRRSTCVEEFAWNEDGTLPFIPFTSEGVKEPVVNLNPYCRVEAETMADSRSLKVSTEGEDVHYVTPYKRIIADTSVANDDTTPFQSIRAVDFGETGASKFTARVRTSSTSIPSVMLRLDGKNGRVVGRLNIKNTGGEWAEVSVDLMKTIKGVHDLFLVYKGSETNTFDMDWWQMTQSGGDPSVGIGEVSGNDDQAKDVVSTSYFTLDGRAQARPLEGVNIVHRTMSDGTVDVRKVMKSR